jgi:hypothetical protein
MNNADEICTQLTNHMYQTWLMEEWGGDLIAPFFVRSRLLLGEWGREVGCEF